MLIANSKCKPSNTFTPLNEYENVIKAIKNISIVYEKLSLLAPKSSTTKQKSKSCIETKIDINKVRMNKVIPIKRSFYCTQVDPKAKKGITQT